MVILIQCFTSCSNAACPVEKRRNFQQRMLEFINKKRALAAPVPETEPNAVQDPSAEPRLNTPAKEAIYWMFDELDVAPMDRQLSSSELSSFQSEVKCRVAPRACAESMTSYCDYNTDGYISLTEWCWCSGLDNSKLTWLCVYFDPRLWCLYGLKSSKFC